MLQKVQSLFSQIEEIKTPFENEVQDLKKENQAFSRELDRYDALYRNMLNDYLNSIEENKKLVEKQARIEMARTASTSAGT